MLFMPWVEYTAGGQMDVFNALCAGGDCAVNGLPLAVLLGVSAVLTIYAVARFKDRKIQIRLLRWNVLAVILSLCVFAVLHYLVIRDLQQNGELSMHYGWIVALPLVTLVLLWLALKAIRKDEDLVRSVDRLR